MNFASSNSARNLPRHGDNERAPRDAEGRGGFSFLNNTGRAPEGEASNSDRLRDRTARNGGRRGGDADQDSEGWSTVKPRKSFGHEGAERFHSRMGTASERFGNREREDRRGNNNRGDERDSNSHHERRNRNSDIHRQEKEAEETDGARRNGLTRNRSEPWYKDNERNGLEGGAAGSAAPATTSTRERMDRNKSWRDRNPEDRPEERRSDRLDDRNTDRRWDRDRESRVEREPEWLDEPAESQPQGRTADDLKKFLEKMKASRMDEGGQKASGAADEASTGEARKSLIEQDKDQDKDKSRSVPAMESGPDKFFEAFGALNTKPKTTAPEAAVAGPGGEGSSAAGAAKAKPGKPSRFTSFFNAQDDSRGKAEQPALPAAQPPAPLAIPNGSAVPQDQKTVEKEAFQMLLQKLQIQAQGSQPQQPQQGQPPPQPGMHDQDVARAQQPIQGYAESANGIPQEARQRRTNMTSPDQFGQYGGDRREQQAAAHLARTGFMEEPMQATPTDPHLRMMMGGAALAQAQEALGHQHFRQQQGVPQQGPQQQQQMLQDLLSQRQHAQGQAGGDSRPGVAGADQTNAEFLMQLMQRHRNGPEPMRTEQLLLRMPQPNKQMATAQQLQEREREREIEFAMAQRDRRQQQQQLRIPSAQPSFLDGPFISPDGDGRGPPAQPRQILQRPPPPGLDHQFDPRSAGPQGGGLPRGAMLPPPGLINNPRSAGGAGPGQQQQQPPPGMFPANFPPGAFSPQDLMAGVGGGPPGPQGRNVPPLPPPGFFGGPPPPGFMGPPPGMGGFSPQGAAGPDGLGFVGGPFDGRGMPPPPGASAYRRS
jgi:hypothetical protein